MFHRQNSVLRIGTGIAVPGAVITVYVNGTDTAGDYTNATKATIYALKTGGTPIPNATVTSDANGHYEYFIPDGIYDEQLSYGSIVEVEDYIQMFDLAGAAATVNAAAATAQAAAATATTKAGEADTSATEAAGSATGAATSASSADASADTATAARDEAVTAANSAQASANASETSRSGAAVSEANAAASAAAAAASAAGGGGGGGSGVTTNFLTFSYAGDGDAAGVAFNGSVARKISYNTIGAQGASALLSAFDALAYVAGVQVPVFTGANAFGLRTVGASAAADLLDRASADARYQAAGAYLTGNQAINLTGDVGGSGTTAISVTIGANKVTRAMLAATAGARILGSSAAGNVTDLTAAQAKTLLAIAFADVAGLAAIAASGSGVDLAAGTVALAKLANISSGQLLYRKTTGNGPPEAQSLATLKTDLQLAGVNSGDQLMAYQADNAATIPSNAPAGGTGTAAGGWDTAANRDAAIATINALVTAVNALKASHNALLAKLKSTTSGVALMASAASTLADTLVIIGDSWLIDYAGYYAGYYKTQRPALNIVNQAVGGSGISSLAQADRRAAVVAQEPKWIHIGIGRNDMATTAGYPTATAWLNALRAEIDYYKAQLPGVAIQVETLTARQAPSSPAFNTEYNARRPTVNTAIRQWLTDGVIQSVADWAADSRLGDDADMNPVAAGPTAISIDGLHLHDRNDVQTGHDIASMIFMAQTDAFVGYAASTFGTLSLSSASFVVGTPSSGTVVGATAGSTITSYNRPAGLSINGAARTWAYDGSGPVASGNLVLEEAKAGFMRKSNSISYAVSGTTSITAPTYTRTSAAGASPLTFDLGYDSTVTPSDFIHIQIATNSSRDGSGFFVTPTQDIGPQLIGGDDWERADEKLVGFTQPGAGVPYFIIGRVERDDGTVSPWFTMQTDTIAASSAALITATGSLKSQYMNVPTSSTWCHNANVGANCAVAADRPSLGNKFHLEQFSGTNAGANAAEMWSGFCDGTGVPSFATFPSAANQCGGTAGNKGITVRALEGSSTISIYSNGTFNPSVALSAAWNPVGDGLFWEVDPVPQVYALYHYRAATGTATLVTTITLTSSALTQTTTRHFVGGAHGDGTNANSDCGSVNYTNVGRLMTPNTGFEGYYA